MKMFEVRFPSITYDMNLKVELANSQAIFDGKTRLVRLYGGLVRHRRIGSAGLAFALAHETGHHLGGPPRMPYYHWLSSEDRATTWALTVGLRRVFGEDRYERIGKRGLEELKHVGLVE